MVFREKWLLIAVSLVVVSPVRLAAEGAGGQFGLRVSGGYGFSLDDQMDYSPSGQPQAVPMATGWASAVELFYTLTPHLGVDFGIYPESITRPERQFALGTSGPYENVDDYATFLPVLPGFEFREPLIEGQLTLLAFIGAGVVPATTLYRPAVAPGTVNETITYDAALALRFYLGLHENLGSGLGMLLGVQELSFDQKNISSSGESLETDDFNQLAPMVGVDWTY